ncbi:hypothetical protein DDE82_003068 [Stemphylium lycopersici]|uniref:Uncharacterized protein n=1 Tax=Stemphylium lycopersici TaxID=183478 RepID=A0A364MWT4_STELY|nr:hypothetical protein TW65_01318 [Stemphylium lycopersici]RAR05199.1 hypothetical protein DDE83_007517 [Stemphylium lycopersici]RAR07126.1 hypothetical protein DDE82_003068 [Stemphylium lycopersici]
MRLSTLILGACTAIAAFASPIQTGGLSNGVAHVVDEDGKLYELENTGHSNVRVISKERKNGYYVRPISFHIEPAHVCNFYLESTRGVGSLIGQYAGPMDAEFGVDWVAFYECWPVGLEARSPAPTYSPCGFVTAHTGEEVDLAVDSRIDFYLHGKRFNPVGYHVLDHCVCKFGLSNGRSGTSPDLVVTGYDSSNDKVIGLMGLHDYECSFTH